MRFIFLILIFINSLFAFNSIEILDENINIKESGYFISDTTLSSKDAKLEFESGKFKEFPKKIFGSDLDSREYWYAFEISIENEKEFYYIDIIDPSILNLELYVYKNAKLIREEKSGYLTPSYLKSIDSKSIRFKLEDTKEPILYLIKSKSVYAKFSGFIFGKNRDIDNFYLTDYLFYILLSSSIFTLLIYNLFIYFSTKDKSYTYYTLYLFALWSIGSLVRGYDYIFIDYIDNYASYQPILFMVMLQMNYFGLTIFSEKFLMLKEKFPRLQKIVRTIFYINALFIILVALNSTTLNILSQIFSISLNTSLLIAGFISYRNGHKPALYYLLATGGMIFLMYIYISVTKGFIEYNILTSNLMLFSAWWDSLLLSFALAYRIKLLQEEKSKSEIMLTMASRHSAIGEFAHNVAHQWRQPLTILSTMVTSLDANIRFRGEVELNNLKEFVKKSNKVISHLSSTIDVFQDFFTHRDNITTNRFNIKEQIQRCCDFTKESIYDSDIKIDLIAKDDIELIGDENEFAQIILNLLSNAKDALIKNREFDRKIDIALDTKDKKIVLTIIDNGGGIKIEPLDKIFEPYISTKSLTGTGIGLFIVKNIIQNRFNGTIDIKNSNDGAIFNIYFNAPS